MSYIEENTDDLNKKLTRVYVALAMTRNLAQSGRQDREVIRSIESLTLVAAAILEDVLDTTEENIPWPLDQHEVDLLM